MLIGAICSDPILARFIGIIKNGMTLIQIVVPIILLVAGTIQFLKLMLNPDNQNETKAVANSFAAAVIVFFIPVIVNLVMSILATANVGVYDEDQKKTVTFDVSSCWSEAKTVSGDSSMNSANDKSNKSIADSNK